MGTAQDVFDAVQSHALATGLFARVNTAEPKSAPGTGLSCAIWVQSIRPAEGASGLAATTARMELAVRLYTNMLTSPEDMIDPNLVAASITLMESYSGDFALSVITTAPTVRNVDLLGQFGTALAAEAGYLNQDGTMFRVITISLPIIVNDLWTQTA
jgi:hypothetical protein